MSSRRRGIKDLERIMAEYKANNWRPKEEWKGEAPMTDSDRVRARVESLSDTLMDIVLQQQPFVAAQAVEMLMAHMLDHMEATLVHLWTARLRVLIDGFEKIAEMAQQEEASRGRAQGLD
jgi:hypothetical protein